MFDIVSLPTFSRLNDLNEEIHMEAKWSFDWSQGMLLDWSHVMQWTQLIVDKFL